MKAVRFLVSILLFASFGALSAETVIGGTAESRLGTLLDPADLPSSTLDGSLQFHPSFHASSDQFEFHFQATLRYGLPDQSLAFSLDSLELAVDPADFLKIVLGRFAYAPGAATFLSPMNYFSIVDYAALLEGRYSEAVLPADLIQARFFWEDFSLILTTAPFPRRPGIPAPDSPWMPRKDLPASIHISFPVEQDLVLENILIEDPALPAPGMQFIGGSVEAAATFQSLDVSVLFYHGFDPSPLVQARFDFPYGLFQGYDVILTPVDRIINAFGLSAVAGVSSFRFIAEISLTLSKTFATNRLSADNFSLILVTAPFVESALGVGYDMGEPRLSLELEWKGSLITSPPDSLIEPMLSQLFFGRASIRLWEDRISLGANAVVALLDWSLVAVADLSFSPSNELSFQLLAPFFFGAADTDLGQFSANHLVTLAAVWRF
jgi:hypothetical protein